MKLKAFIKKIILFSLFVASMYGLSILYYAVTAGFTIGNVTSNLTYHPEWDTTPVTQTQKELISEALNQEYSYLGKGCQSYVFESRDGEYVIKFVKFQRFRPQAWIDLFTFIPAVEKYQVGKGVEKYDKLDKMFISWKIAYEYLRDQTGVIYVHLNKGRGMILPTLVIRDKMGLKHYLDLNEMEFLLQSKAEMFESTINDLMANGALDKATSIIDQLMEMLLWEYRHGFADNDHALMQNTGVLDGKPIHIDAGQFIKNNIVKNPNVYSQEIYDKTYDFRVWLDKKYPELGFHLKARLIEILGIDYYYMAPYSHKGHVAKIPNE